MVCNGQDEKGLPPTPDTLHLGCSSYHLHSSQRFLSTWGAVMLEKEKETKTKEKGSVFPGPNPNPNHNPNPNRNTKP